MTTTPDLLADLQTAVLIRLADSKTHELAAVMANHPSSENTTRVVQRLTDCFDQLIREEQERPVSSTTS